jgi:RAB protein geranylgeranyltransferase component A
VNRYYGGDEASLSLNELIQWADGQSSGAELGSPSFTSKFTSISHSTSSLPHEQQYSISLSPSIIPSVGPLVSALVSSGVAKYGGFRLLEQVGIYDPSGVVKTVPDSKEGVFKNKDISLIDKRRLMRFLMFSAGEFEGASELEGKDAIPFFDFLMKTFSLNEEMAHAIVYGLTYCTVSAGIYAPIHQPICRSYTHLQSLLYPSFDAYAVTSAQQVAMALPLSSLATMVAPAKLPKASVVLQLSLAAYTSLAEKYHLSRSPTQKPTLHSLNTSSSFTTSLID